MLGDAFWNLATSVPVLGIDGLLLLAAAVIGWFPLLKYAPVIGPYVPTARLVAVLVALVMAFLLGARVMDEREEAKGLRIEVAMKQQDLEAAQHANADALARANEIEGKADAQHAMDQDYIAHLQANPACTFDPGPVPAGRVRVVPFRYWRPSIFGSPKAKPAGSAGEPDKAAAGPGS